MRQCFRVGSWEVDPATNRIEGDGRAVHLEPKVMDLLVALAARPGEVLSRERLFAEVWPDLHVSDEALTTAVYQLRRVLGDSARAPRFLETVPKRGYRLVAPVEPIEPVPPVRAADPGRSRGHRWVLAAALAIVAVLAGVPDPREGSGMAPESARYADSELLQRGRRSLDRWGPQPVASALADFEAAVARDPGDPLALAGLAESLVRARTWGLLAPEVADRRAREAAAAAVELAPDQADTHRALALIRMGLDWDFTAAEAGARRALALDPDHAGAHGLLAQLHLIAGRPDEALADMARARRSAPGSPALHSLSGVLASVLGRPEEAERHYLRARELDPDDPQAAQALAKLEARRRGEPEAAEPAARDVLDRVAASVALGEVAPSDLASLYAEIGERGQALEWLDRAWARRDPGLFFLRYDSRWDPYREHPRVRAILSRLSPS